MKVNLNSEIIEGFTLLVQAILIAYKKGVYSMRETSIIVEAIDKIKKYIPNEVFINNEEKKEELNE